MITKNLNKNNQLDIIPIYLLISDLNCSNLCDIFLILVSFSLSKITDSGDIGLIDWLSLILDYLLMLISFRLPSTELL